MARSVQQLFDLTGQTALVTGGVSGLGEASAIALLERGLKGAELGEALKGERLQALKHYKESAQQA